MKRQIQIQNYSVHNVIYKYAMCGIYDVINKDNMNHYAIKEISNKELAQNEMLAFNLNHENIIQVFDYFSVGNNHYFVMELGVRDYFDWAKKITNKEQFWHFKVMVREILDGIVYMHANHIIHCDLKMENILLFDGHCRICDFGNALINKNDANILYLSSPSGTVNYMPPEMVNKRFASYKTDVWNYGLILRNTLNVFYNLGIEKDEEYNEVLIQMRDIISLCLKKDYNKRPSSNDIRNHPFFNSVEK